MSTNFKPRSTKDDVIIVYHIRIIHSRFPTKCNKENKKKIYLSQYEEIKLPKSLAPNPEEQARNVREMKYRDGDILICAYPKSGVNWTEILIRSLLRKDGDERFPIRPACVDLNPPELFTSMPSPRVMYTHFWPHRLPKEHVENRGKMILLSRNPKDVVVSSFHHYKKATALEYPNNWDEHIDAFMTGDVFFGDMFEYLENFEAAIKAAKFDIKHFYNEDLKLKPVETLKGIADNIGVEKTNEELKSIMDECSIEKLKNRVNLDILHHSIKDENNQYVMLRKGIVGDWKNHFTVAKAERFDELIKEKLKDSMFQFDYE